MSVDGHAAVAPPSNVMNSRRSLDHLVGTCEQGPWDGETERFGGPEIDDQLHFRHLLHRQVCRSFTLENAASVDTHRMVLILLGLLP